MNWLTARLKEGSTWRGLIMLITVFGLHLTPEAASAVVTVLTYGLTAAGALGIAIPEQK